jgi:hypothetical protein
MDECTVSSPLFARSIDPWSTGYPRLSGAGPRCDAPAVDPLASRDIMAIDAALMSTSAVFTVVRIWLLSTASP